LKIEAIRIQSFKSFADTGWVELSPHFTVLVGQNNSGKSAFLRAFNSASFESSPHRSALRPEGRSFPPTVISFRLAVEGREVAEQARSNGLWLPVNQYNDAAIIKAHLVEDRLHTLETKYGMAPVLAGAPSYGLFDTDNVWSMLVGVDDQTGKFQVQSTTSVAPPPDGLPDFVAGYLRRTTFVFNAERYSIGRSPMQAHDRLAPDASNLPYMLLRLNKDYARMERSKRSFLRSYRLLRGLPYQRWDTISKSRSILTVLIATTSRCLSTSPERDWLRCWRYFT